jgi:hypothetical protein
VTDPRDKRLQEPGGERESGERVERIVKRNGIEKIG